MAEPGSDSPPAQTALKVSVLNGNLSFVRQALLAGTLAAILGAALAARWHAIPVVLDGFIATAAAAPLAMVREILYVT